MQSLISIRNEFSHLCRSFRARSKSPSVSVSNRACGQMVLCLIERRFLRVKIESHSTISAARSLRRFAAEFS